MPAVDPGIDHTLDAIFADRRVVTRQELADALGIGLTAVKESIRSGELNEIVVGPRTRRIGRSQVAAWLAARTVGVSS